MDLLNSLSVRAHKDNILHNTDDSIISLCRVMCFFRRSELSPTLLSQADKHHWGDSNFDSTEPDSDDEDNTVKVKFEKYSSKKYGMGAKKHQGVMA